ncbi:MAG: hypothetical protein J5747_04330 [Spirochaetaceae bacterium]|nr:hypothetical protein [Spirochaetaceae bacterium]
MRQFVLFLIFTLSSLYAEETITLRNEAEYCVINSNEISFLYYKIGEGESEITCQNQIQTEYSIPFVYSNKANKKILFLNNGYIAKAMLSSDESLFFNDFLGYFSMKDSCYIWPIGPAKCTTTSSLTENGYTYSASNLSSKQLGTPWVEGVIGSGIGEKITIKKSKESLPPWVKTFGGGALVIFNGFISYEKPYLYEYNNRVKELKIYTSNNDYCFNVILEDTPNPQIIFLPCESEDTIIEILSVYKGLRYDDTCIECIASFSSNQADILYKLMKEKGEKVLGFINGL